MSTPDIRYNKSLSLRLEDGFFDGGLAYCEEAYGKGRYRFGMVKAFDCSDYVQNDHIGLVNAYIKRDVIVFPNGIGVDVHIYNLDNNPYSGIQVALYAHDKDGENVPTLYNGVSYNLQRFPSLTGCFSGDLITQGFKIYFVSNYYALHVNTPPIENLTSPDFFELSIVFPAMAVAAGTVHYLNDLNGVVQDGVMSILYDSNIQYGFTNEDGVQLFKIELIYTDDLDAFYGVLEAAGGEITNKYQIKEPNPPQEQDPSGPGGGDGDYTNPTGPGSSEYDPSSDAIDFPTLPSGGALSTGAIKGFLVGSATIYSMFADLWNASLFDINTFQKLLTEPLDAIISLHCLPLVPSVGNTENIKLGNYNFNGAISAPVISNQYITIDCGELDLTRFWGSALDYAPYTKVDIFLPFIGIKTLNADDTIGFKLSVKYNIDVLSGDLTACIKCGLSVLYKFQGNCKATIPISAKVNEALANLVKGAGSIAMGAAAGGMAGAGAAALSAAINTSLSKISVARSGDLSGGVGLLDEFTPYVIIHRPIQSLASNFNNYKGYPTNITAQLGSVNGYTEVEYVHLTGINGATDTELNEIENLLKNGVLI